jgi:mono/diheme cytochrome c family protein
MSKSSPFSFNVSMRAARLISLLAAGTLLAAGCGGGSQKSNSSATSGGGSSTSGKQVFADAACGSCHTLDAAGRRAQSAPTSTR